MNSTIRFMFATAAAVLLPLYLTFNYQAVQGAQQDISLEERIAQLQQRVQADSRNPDLHFELSKLYEEVIERYYDEALSEFEDAVDNGVKGRMVIWNGFRDVNAHVGAVTLQSGNYGKAIEYEKKLLI